MLHGVQGSNLRELKVQDGNQIFSVLSVAVGCAKYAGDIVQIEIETYLWEKALEKSGGRGFMEYCIVASRDTVHLIKTGGKGCLWGLWGDQFFSTEFRDHILARKVGDGNPCYFVFSAVVCIAMYVTVCTYCSNNIKLSVFEIVTLVPLRKSTGKKSGGRGFRSTCICFRISWHCPF